MGGIVSKSGGAPSASKKAAMARQEAVMQHAQTQKRLIRLGDDIPKKIGSFLSPKEMQTAELELSKPRGEFPFFQSTIDDLSVLNDVITGNLKSLIAAFRNNSELLFRESYTITDPAGRIFYNVSPYKMMLFLCDNDMLEHVMRVVSPLPKELRKKRKPIHASLQQGGADLIKLDQDPMLLDFKNILHFKTTCTLFDEIIKEVAFPLLENPDGILYYKDEYNQDHWYYANQATRTIQPIQLSPELTLQQQEEYVHLVAQMEAMEPMSARRSSNDEHLLIANTMSYFINVKTKAMAPVKLVRQGITYIQDGIRYCDTRHDFNRYTNAYRKSIRFYAQEEWNVGDDVFKRELGHAQKEVIWLLQRYCDDSRSFYPLAVDYQPEPFRRGFKFQNWVDGMGAIDYIYSANTGVFAEGFGSTFGLVRGQSRTGVAAPGAPLMCGIDLTAIIRLVEDAKTNVAELLNPNLTQHGPAAR